MGDHAQVAGWGRTSWRGSRSKELLQAILKVLSNKECRQKFAGFKDGKKSKLCCNIACNIILSVVDIADSKLCAGDRNDAGACLGDSGGALVTLEQADDNRCKNIIIEINTIIKTFFQTVIT